MSLIAKIRAAKTVAGINRLINPIKKRKPLNRGVDRVARARIAELAEKVQHAKRVRTFPTVTDVAAEVLA